MYIDIVKYLDDKGWEEDKTQIIVYLISALHLICKNRDFFNMASKPITIRWIRTGS